MEGRLTFAMVMFFAAATVNTTWGIAALANDDHFAVHELVFGDLSLWGALYLGVAAAQVLAGVLILRRNVPGMILGILMAMLSGVVAMVSLAAYPLWSATVLVIDGLIIHTLTVYGVRDGKPSDRRR